MSTDGKPFAKIGECEEWEECVELCDGTKFSVDIIWDNREATKKGIVEIDEDVMVNLLNSAFSARVKPLVEALEKLRDCDWTISLPDRMDAVRAIATKAFEEFNG